MPVPLRGVAIVPEQPTRKPHVQAVVEAVSVRWGQFLECHERCQDLFVGLVSLHDLLERPRGDAEEPEYSPACTDMDTIAPGSSGHVRVSVAKDGATLEYVKSRLTGTNAEVVDRVVLKPSGGR